MVTEQAKASPTKAFFVDMLVKDINLDSAILDLVDNCMDGARGLRGDGPYNGLSVKIRVSPHEFVIEDNCGGIDVDVARNYAFRFGRDPGIKPLEKSLGVFGVGMKRAIFKMGRDVYIKSTTKSHSFEIKLNIREWQENDDPNSWFFPMTVNKLASPPPDNELGTLIKITSLCENVGTQFDLPYFGPGLRRAIGSRHERYINQGITIQLNGTTIPGTTVTFAYLGQELLPACESAQLDGVSMTLYAGVGELKRIQAGWYIYCNGRMVVEHDQTELTGWGESVEKAIPKMHYQFSRFRGCVYFDSEDSSKLPWNTTKDGIDVTSDVYRSAKSIMISHARTVIDFLNKVDKELDEPEDKRVLTDILNRAAYQSPLLVPKAAKFTYKAVPPKPPPEFVQVRIYVSRADMARLTKCLGAQTNKAAVEAVVRWYLDNECSDVEE